MPAAPNNHRAPHQLPSGRHGLPRTYVIRNQRERILDAVVNVVGDRGYAAMTIEDVIAYAGVSRRTFYDHFPNKEEAFLAAYELIVDQLIGAVAAAFGGGSTWAHRVRRGLGAFLNSLALEPRAAHVCVVESLAAGPRALARRAAAMERFREFLTPSPRDVAADHEVPELAAETAIGGVYEVVYAKVLAGETEALPQLLPELLHSILLPFAGADLAAAEYRAAVHSREQRTAAPAEA
jgi:AcrR family transcriptional regulator